MCDGCGHTFNTDVSKGYGFTGFGYYDGQTWVSFPKPFAQMTASEKRGTCQAAFTTMGWSCPASEVNLVCFRAGGYPKKDCGSWCADQGAKTKSVATYTPQATWVSMVTMYGPWGHKGVYPSYSTTPARCDWNETSTTTITRLDIALGDGLMATSGGSRWVSGSSFAEQTTVHGITPLSGESITIAIVLRAAGGPVMQGRRITKGCGPDKANSSSAKCFGASQTENLSVGAALLVVGLTLICGPLLCLCALCGCCLLVVNRIRGRKGSMTSVSGMSDIAGSGNYAPAGEGYQPPVAYATPV